MRVVLDTNVLVSGLISAAPPPGRIVDLLRSGDLTLCVDDRILGEYESVLRRASLAPYVDPSDAEHIIDFIRTCSQGVLAPESVLGLPDPRDAPFLEVGMAAAVVLVTGNLRHYPTDRCDGVTVMTPAQFIERHWSKG